MADSIDALSSVSASLDAQAKRLTTTPQSEPKSQTEDLGVSRISPEQINAAIESQGNRVTFGGRSAEFSYEPDSHTIVIKIFDTDDPNARKLIRQIPPEEFLRFAAKLRDLSGALFDEKA